MKETRPSRHTASEPFTPTVGVKNRYSVLARGRFSPARLAKAPTLGSDARVDSQTALCRAGTAAIQVVFVGFPPGVRRSERRYLGANRSDCARLPRFHAWIARKSCLTHPRLYQRLYQPKTTLPEGPKMRTTGTTRRPGGPETHSTRETLFQSCRRQFSHRCFVRRQWARAPALSVCVASGFRAPALAAVADARTPVA